MNKITIFLNLGMQGLGTKTFLNVDLEGSVNDFLQRIADQEGAVGCDWIRTGTKVITGTQFGHVKLKEFGFYNEITLWGSLRLKGGAEQKQQFDAAKIKQFGGSIIYGSCGLCLCAQTNAKLTCGCIYCTQCMRMSIDRDVNKQCASNLSCYLCKQNIDTTLAFEVAAYSDKEKGVADQQLFRNSLKKPDSMMSECASCKQIIIKKALNGNKQQCHVCKKHTCQICKLLWVNNDGNDKTFCGNDVCDPSIMYQTFLDYAQDKEIYGVIVTNTRFCPKCLKVNIHAVDCKHITCPCTHQYCHICLNDWIGHNNDLCGVADTQKITKEMILKLAKQ